MTQVPPEAPIQAFSLAATYIHLRPDDSALAMEGGDKFWAGVEDRRDLEQGRLMGVMPQTADWDHWERHPAGEEILTMLSGELEIVLAMKAGEERAVLKAGQTLVVPAGIWHRGIVRIPGELLFVTAGAGTEHRPVTL
ncbi:MAG: cupin domain-containing protein [Rhodospirillaceae bacterium]|nr:cupin domain-containing protein [Rhodospirillaceae bacterium]